MLTIFAQGTPPQTGYLISICYVDDEGSTLNGCTSWTDACSELQIALDKAGQGACEQIRVAAGTYLPDYDPSFGHTGSRAATFQLLNTVAIYGGFEGNLFTENFSSKHGGAIYIQNDESVTNSTFVGNSAADKGGGVFVADSAVVANLNNCVFWDNSDLNGMGESSQIHFDDGQHNTLTVTYSDIMNVVAGGQYDTPPNVGNIGDDPTFVDPPADNFRLAAGSPCIDAADNTEVPFDVTDLDGDGNFTERTPWDLDGNPRFVDDPNTPDEGVDDPGPPPIPEVVDMGAYEFQP